ncbi:MAG: hypothetical protein GDA40_06865 [Rhodobacteraceae bacterium]|nr:hypothetical protein [Paracoccaceae bacterium]
MQFWDRYAPIDLLEKQINGPTWEQKFYYYARYSHYIPTWSYHAYLQWRMARTRGNYYFTHYANLLNNGGIATDLTPNYALLSKETCQKIMGSFESQGISFRAVYTMRDPVKRAVSHFAMYRFGPLHGPRWVEQTLGVPRDSGFNQAFQSFIRLEYHKAISDYKKTIDTMTAAYPEEQREFVLFEEMIRGVKLQELSDFLGVSYRPDAIGAPVNAQKRSVVLDEEVLQECAQLCRPTYEAIAKMFPQTETLWSGWKCLR